jgi:DNA-binding transcriptional LysR family regulator
VPYLHLLQLPSGIVFPWEFSQGAANLIVHVNGPLALDDQEMMVETAVHGAGVAFVWEGRAEPHLRAGRLMRCLINWCPPFGDLFLYYPRERHISAALRALIDALKQRVHGPAAAERIAHRRVDWLDLSSFRAIRVNPAPFSRCAPPQTAPKSDESR